MADSNPNACGHYYNTAICTDYNPVGNCWFAQQKIRHLHHYCIGSPVCGSAWITFLPPLPARLQPPYRELDIEV